MYNHPAPSAGRINRAIFGNGDMDKIPKHILENATNRGKWVHKSIEQIINGEDYEGNWEWESYIDAFKKFQKDFDPEYIFTELPIVSKDERTKGVIDAFAKINGEYVLLDFKTSASTINHSWRMQLMIYHYILKQEDDYPTPQGIRVVKLVKDGTYRILYYEYDENVVESALTLYEYMKEEDIL